MTDRPHYPSRDCEGAECSAWATCPYRPRRSANWRVLRSGGSAAPCGRRAFAIRVIHKGCRYRKTEHCSVERILNQADYHRGDPKPNALIFVRPYETPTDPVVFGVSWLFGQPNLDTPNHDFLPVCQAKGSLASAWPVTAHLDMSEPRRSPEKTLGFRPAAALLWE